MRRLRPGPPLSLLAVLLLVLSACGGDGADPADRDTDTAADPGVEEPDADADTDVDVPDGGPPIVVSSFDFPESTILAEVYGQALEAAGYPVERELNVGSRELLFPELEEGGVSLLAEYLGSALVVGFGQEPPADVHGGLEELREAFAGIGISVLEAAPAENSNVFVTTSAFAEANDLSTVADLSGVDNVVLAGPPECETRDTCLVGLQDVYGLTNVQFESIGEGSARLVALLEGDADLILLFSTDAVLADDQLRALEDPEAMIPPENIVPVVSTEVLDFYGDDLAALLDSISASLTTEVLVGFNERANEGTAPDQIARDFLTEVGVL